MAHRPANNLARVQRLIDEADRLEYKGIDAWRERARLAVASEYGESSEHLARFNRISFSLSIATDTTPASAWRDAAFRGVQRATALLDAVAEDIQERGEARDLTSSLPPLHPWLGDVVSLLWSDGHRRQAVQTAATGLESHLRTKLGVHQGSAASLVASAFSTSPATPSQPRLRFSQVGLQGSDEWNNAHDGAGAFGRGCMLRIRNRYTHNGGANESEDLEALMALSLFARWIESAAVERAAE